MSASLIGRLGSSAFRLSAIAVSMSLVEHHGPRRGRDRTVRGASPNRQQGTAGICALALHRLAPRRRHPHGPQHIHNGVLTITQEKTGTLVSIPVHPKLREIIAATKSVGVKTYLVTHQGKGYIAPRFGNLFRNLCNEACCPGVSAHGLRKATATRLADIGCSEHEIASILGHTSIAVVEFYTRAANRKRLAQSAMQKLVESEK
jgi:integrase